MENKRNLHSDHILTIISRISTPVPSFVLHSPLSNVYKSRSLPLTVHLTLSVYSKCELVYLNIRMLFCHAGSLLKEKRVSYNIGMVRVSSVLNHNYCCLMPYFFKINWLFGVTYCRLFLRSIV